jgi:hypothetical protein
MKGDRDVLGTSKFTALVPLILAVHNPWPQVRGDGKMLGAQTIGHMRPARPGNHVVFIAGDRIKTNPDTLMADLKYRLGCKDGAYTEHIVLGGPRGAVIYEDEMVVPGYHYVEGERENLPFTYIVDSKDRDLIINAFYAGARQASQLRNGETPKVANVAVSGVLTTAQLGPVMIQYDRVFRVHQLTQYNPQTNAHEPKLFVNFKNGTSLRMGEMIVHPKLRAKLGLDVLPTNVRSVKAPEQKPMVSLRDVLPEVSRIAPVSVTPAVIYLPAPREDEAAVENEQQCKGSLILEAMSASEIPEIKGVNGEILFASRKREQCDAKLMLAIGQAMENEEIDFSSVDAAWMIWFHDTWMDLA